MKSLTYLCSRCGIDVTDFTPVEVRAHAEFHRLMDESPKSIPSQDNRPSPLSQLWASQVVERRMQQ